MKYIDEDKLIAEIERWRDKEKEDYSESTYSMGRCDALAEFRNHIVSLLEEQPEDIVVIAKTFLDALSKTPYNNKPITDAQIIAKQLLLFFENPKEYNPDAILEQPEETCKTCGLYENNCPFIRGKLIPYPNKVRKDYIHSVMKEQEQPKGNLEYWLEHFGMPKENIDNCITQIAQGYGACRYLEGIQHGAEAVNELAKQEQPEVELEKEVKDYFMDSGYNLPYYECWTIAKHFFELGLSARKEETK